MDLGKFTAVQSLNVINGAVDRAPAELESVKDVSGVAALLAEYAALNTDVQATLDTAPNTDSIVLSNKVNEYNSRLADLSRRKDTALRGQRADVSGNFLAEVRYGFIDNIKLIALLSGTYLGGVVASHYYIEKAWYYKLFYFVYGALLFPITVLMGIFNPPVWRAMIVPLFQRGETGFMNLALVNFLSLFFYRAPSIDDSNFMRQFLRVACIVAAVIFVSAYVL